MAGRTDRPNSHRAPLSRRRQIELVVLVLVLLVVGIGVWQTNARTPNHAPTATAAQVTADSIPRAPGMEDICEKMAGIAGDLVSVIPVDGKLDTQKAATVLEGLDLSDWNQGDLPKDIVGPVEIVNRELEGVAEQLRALPIGSEVDSSIFPPDFVDAVAKLVGVFTEKCAGQ